ncbi:probable beta-1,3-galactosyltransferase 12 isoform X1 [Amborella trichopoda]|uniref:probable beta-1,3-galactosyltransferase 12 isoform X1 n=1 Tax=Amborella trichopoda TaxID=13333 RepID=UPI0009BC9BF3|nr:probable beta-1,3-galactosyltransferase 12 isoform X1 [Amborella trichopoda]|eukprot:XP_020531657.1 probable beta-1,3-galactosyltransferase 12 isoform X1 [Amborella trichopoda]
MSSTTSLLPFWRKRDDDGKLKGKVVFRPHNYCIPLLCFCIAVSGILLSAYALLRPKPVYIFRCGRAQDTLRTFLASSHYQNSHSNSHSDPLVDRPKLLGMVGIQTGFSSKDRRQALRETWFPSNPDGLISLEHSTGLAFRFVIGHTKDVKKMAELEEEIEKYNDFMVIDVEEDYLKLPYKTLAFFKAAFDLFEAEFYVKADDDIYLRPDRLATLLAKERPDTRTYIGCMKKGPVITDPKMKWFEKSGHLLGNEYFYHAYGPIYALSAEVVASLAIARNDSLRMFSNEDVTVGSWMLAMNVNHEDNRAICDPRCTPTSIAVWDLPKCSDIESSREVRFKASHKIGAEVQVYYKKERNNKKANHGHVIQKRSSSLICTSMD